MIKSTIININERENMMNITTRKVKLVLLLIISIIGLLLTGACSNEGTKNSSSASSNVKEESDKEKTKVNIAINGGLNLLTIAKYKGWFEEEFKKENTEVNWVEFQSSAAVLEAIASNRVDFSFVGEGSLVTGITSKIPMKAISVTGVEGNQNSIIVQPGSPIKTIADLKGKTIAIAKASSAHIFLIKALEKNGLKESDVNLIQLEPTEALPAFQTGKVDAWGTWDPYVTTEVEEGRARIVESVKTMNFLSPALMIGSDKFLQEHPDLAATYLKVYQKTVDWLPDNIDEAADILAEEKKMDKKLVKMILQNNHYINSPISEDISKSVQSTADILYKLGTIREEVDIDKAYDNSFLDEALKK